MTMGSPRDKSKLSTDPRAVRARLRRKASKIAVNNAAIAEEMLLLPGYKPLEEWDAEELARGRPRGADGRFSQTPEWLKTIPIEEIKRRLREKVYENLAIHSDAAVKAISEILTNDDVDYDTGKPVVDARTRLDAAKFIVEHVIGKPKIRVDEESVSALGKVLATAIVNPDGSDEIFGGRVIDGEWVEDDDEPANLPAVRGGRRGSRRQESRVLD